MATTSNGNDNTLDEIASRVPAGVIPPPSGVREIIEKTAGYVARNGATFEERIREKEGNAKLSFLVPDDAYHAYYRWRVDEIKAGRTNAIAAGRENEVTFRGREARKGPEKPEDFQFSARMPKMGAQDLEVVRLTALYVAKNGRSWMTALSQREAGNFQFDFLRPQNSLHQYFLKLVDQYTDLLTGDDIDSGRPQKKRIVELESNITNRAHILERARKRAEYNKHQEAQKVAKEEKENEEKIAYAQIDWHDFVVVETIVFDENDEMTEMPAPTTLNDLQSASLEEKAAMSIDPSRRLEEAFPSFDDQSQPQPQAPKSNGYAAPTQVNDSNFRITSLQADRERARAAQEAARNSATQPMKIRSDHIPRAQAKKSAASTSICPNCKQAIPNDEMAEHIRIEMLDPRWREQSKIAQHRSSTTNLSTADVANNLKRLASQRSDVFDPVTGRAISDAERDAKRLDR